MVVCDRTSISNRHCNNNIQLATISSKRDAFYNLLVTAPPVLLIKKKNATTYVWPSSDRKKSQRNSNVSTQLPSLPRN